ncbi:hypothetical protein EHS13_08315 [Paenibacillus psychroresistens]|uniref:Beta-glucosidase n=1 Tax=Paenibacillus psychroresistens TaxID=1778678 RepID=A0A6B8RFE0_9BACL|nr:GH116 family glycosyl-hydrolase [Paenibacillus psychroresistens]QGQ94880.1 hypothetical protein EHS13_08315 [Paenibacillus psychroresistens]
MKINSENRFMFPGEASEAKFLLGGIGTGNVSLGSRGELRDWEIFNHANKGLNLPNTFFTIWAKSQGAAPVTKILESQLAPPHWLGPGYPPITAAGLPRLKSSRLIGEYPIARVEFEDNDLPVEVELEAYTPFIPLQADDSGLPCFQLTYKVTNTSEQPVSVSIAGSLFNPIGGLTYDQIGYFSKEPHGQSINQFKVQDGLAGLYLASEKYDKDHLQYGNLSFTTTNRDVTYKRAWLRGDWFDYLQNFWDDFSEDGRLTDLGYEEPSAEGNNDTGSLAVHEQLLPGESRSFQFMVAWYFPNRMNGWNDFFNNIQKAGNAHNRYAARFNSSWEVSAYAHMNWKRLSEATFLFRDALFESTLPDYVIDALAANITVIRSSTCFWLSDGRFLAYEGSFDTQGSCAGNCTHVWNYAQTLAFLFPELERNMRQTEFLEEVAADGKMNFRAFHLFDAEFMWQGKESPPAVDGQLGSIMRVYREWKLSGDNEFLWELWPNVQKALDFALTHWDTDGDYLLDAKQHNTYDIEFYGPNPLSGVMFLGALKAVIEIAAYLKDDKYASKCLQIFEKSGSELQKALWNGEYYIQRLEDVNQYKYQHGTGCLSDQLLGQQLAHLYGLGYLLPKEYVRKAILAVYQNNFKEDFSNHVNCQRTYVMNDEQGLVLCSWPYGEQPKLPFIYSQEVWTGIEYQVATHLIYEGFIEEGLRMVKAVRDRHDGFRRNPWNEVECGHHYARSLASWGVLIALSGFSFDMVQKRLKFEPVLNSDNFSCFWSAGSSWGIYRQSMNAANGMYEPKVEVLGGSLSGVTIEACGQVWVE